jgi:hypothetical protein
MLHSITLFLALVMFTALLILVVIYASFAYGSDPY